MLQCALLRVLSGHVSLGSRVLRKLYQTLEFEGGEAERIAERFPVERNTRRYVCLPLPFHYCPQRSELVSSINKIREKGASTTRKLVGHSGPVYSVTFDSVGGSASPPKYLLSASADATTRLWSLDTMTNVVSYRGHQNPVWDVKWSPMGIYFATASRDRTARLWSTDRTSALRIYAGHLSDVNVRLHTVAYTSQLIYRMSYRLSDSTLTRCTLGPPRVTAQPGCGTCSVGRVSVSFIDTTTSYPRWPSAQMVVTSLRLVRDVEGLIHCLPDGYLQVRILQSVSGTLVLADASRR